SPPPVAAYGVPFPPSFLARRFQPPSSYAAWPPPPCVTSPNRVRLPYGSQVCFPGFRQKDCSASLRFRYMHERAIYMVNSFQFTRSARLSLVYLSRQAPPEAHSSTTFTYDPRHPVPTIGGSFTTQRGLVAAGGWE